MMTTDELNLYCEGWDLRRDGLERDLLGLPIYGGRLTPRAFERVYWCFYELYDGWGSDGLKGWLWSWVASFEKYVDPLWATDHTVAELVGFAVLYDGQGVGLAPHLVEFAGWCGFGYDATTSAPIVWAGIFAELFAQVVCVSLRGVLK